MGETSLGRRRNYGEQSPGSPNPYGYFGGGLGPLYTQIQVSEVGTHLSHPSPGNSILTYFTDQRRFTLCTMQLLTSVGFRLDSVLYLPVVPRGRWGRLLYTPLLRKTARSAWQTGHLNGVRTEPSPEGRRFETGQRCSTRGTTGRICTGISSRFFTRRVCHRSGVDCVGG